MRTIQLLGAAALVGIGLGASPASALLSDVCYKNDSLSSGAEEFFRLSVKRHGSLSNPFERPKVVAYAVHGKTSDSIQGQEGGAAIGGGTVLVGVGEGARMTLNVPAAWVTCTSTESSPTPREWTCRAVGVVPTAQPNPTAPAAFTLTESTLKRVDPRHNPLCGGLPPIPPPLP